MIRLAPLAPLVAALLLAGCNGDQAPAEEGAASGEILPGSISDAMIPTDTVQSQPPLMAPEPAGAGATPEDGAEGEESASEDDAAPDAAAPAQEDAPAQ